MSLSSLDTLFLETQQTFRRMRFSAPRSCSIEQLSGRYHLAPWSESEVSSYLAIGGWFTRDCHFADSAAKKLALGD